jgi:hypothetical protein
MAAIVSTKRGKTADSTPGYYNSVQFDIRDSIAQTAWTRQPDPAQTMKEDGLLLGIGGTLYRHRL